MSRLHAFLRSFVLLALLGMMLPTGYAREDEPVRVGTYTPVHPILIRNEQGPLQRIRVEAAGKKEVRIRSMTFDLSKTDDLRDIASLTLFSTGAEDSFSTGTPLGVSVLLAKTITFPVDMPLKKGRNVFWISCRLNDKANLLHKVDASLESVETTLGQHTSTQQDPRIRRLPHRIGVALRKHKDDGVHTYRIPAPGTSPRGTLLCVYDMRRRMGRDLQEDIDIGLSRSTDGGQTWEPARVIMDMGEFGGLPQSQNGCSDPGIIIDQKTGEIFCFALWMNGKPGKHQWVDDGSEPGFEIGKSAQFMMVRSKDDGRTWSKPENLTRKLKREEWWLLAPSPQQGIQLPDGTLVMPVQGREGKGNLETFATVMISKDHGETWTVGKPGITGGNECQAVHLGDGSIMLNVRNDRERYRAIAVTKDLGQTWTEHPTSRNTLIEPNCNGSLLRIDYSDPEGQSKPLLLFANPQSQIGRIRQTIQTSFDEGKTWSKDYRLMLDEGAGAGYPSLTRIDKDHVGIVYEGSQAQLVFEKIPIRDLILSRWKREGSPPPNG